MARLGVLFDIDALGGGLYGYAAYKIFFAAVDSRELHGCTLCDGDTMATLSGSANHYCIAVDSYGDPPQLVTLRRALSASTAPGLLPLHQRFIESPAADREPLVVAGRVTWEGTIVDCKTSWVLEAWRDCQKSAGARTDNAPVTPAPPPPHLASHPGGETRHWWKFWAS